MTTTMLIKIRRKVCACLIAVHSLGQQAFLLKEKRNAHTHHTHIHTQTRAHTQAHCIMRRLAFTYQIDGLVTFSNRNSLLGLFWPLFLRSSPFSNMCVCLCVFVHLCVCRTKHAAPLTSLTCGFLQLT